MSMCRSWLKAVRMTADAKTRAAMTGAAVLGDNASGYTVELRDGSQIHVGRQDCAYCARAEAFSQVSSRIDEGRALCDFAPATPTKDLEPTACMCGHSVEEHGHDPKFPASTACRVKRCKCIAFEGDVDE
jgi:hypothetical protein